MIEKDKSFFLLMWCFSCLHFWNLESCVTRDFDRERKFCPLKMRTSWFALSFLCLFLFSLLSSLIQESATHSAYGQEFSGGMPSTAEASAFWLLGGEVASIAIIVHKNSGIYSTKSSLRADRLASAIPLSPWRKRQKNQLTGLCQFCTGIIGESGPGG